MKAAITIDGVEILVPELNGLATKGGRRLAQIVLKAGLNVIGKQMQRDLDPKVKEAGKAVGNRVTIYRQNVTRAKVGFNVGKNASKVPFTRKRTSKGGIGIGPRNVHWYITGTGERWRYGDQGRSASGKPLSLRQRRASSIRRQQQGAMRTGVMPAQQPGLAADAARKSLSEVRSVMQRAGGRYLEARARKIEKQMARTRAAAAERRLLIATGKG